MTSSTFRSPVLAAVVALALCGAVTACRGRQSSSAAPSAAGTAAESSWTPSLRPLAIPAGANSAYPQLTSSARGTILSWIEQNGATATLRYAERTGGEFGPAVSVTSGSDWFISAADVPTVLRLSDGTLAANWYQTTQIELEAYNLWLSHSRDDGKTWAKPFMPHHDGTKTQHGFASLFELPQKGLGLVWLDAREWELNREAADGGTVMLRYASFDTSWKQTADDVVNMRVCDCCQTSVAVTGEGVIAAFRDRSDAEIRDIHVTRLENGKWTAAEPVHADNWEIDSCPVNGPAISARGRDAVTAWFAAPNQQGHSYVAFSHDAGRTWQAPVRLDDTASTGHVDVEMLDDGSAVATWIEFSAGRGRLRMRRVEASGSKSAAIDVAGASGAARVSGYPHLVKTGDGLVVTWAESQAEEDSADAVQQVKAALVTGGR